MVEEAGCRIGDRGWILIEDDSSGTRGRRVDDAVHRRMLHHVVERRPPVVQPQIDAACGRLLLDELLVGRIQSKSHRGELRDLRGQLRNGEVPSSERAQDLELLPEIGEREPGLASRR